MPSQADTPARTQAERSAASDHAMIEAAIDLLLSKGSAGTTLAAIGEKAGYSRGLATYRFGSKAGLFDQICRTISRRWLTILTEMVGEQIGVDAMCTALDAYLRFIRETPRDAKVMQLLYGEATNPNSESAATAVETYKRQIADVCEWIVAGQDANTIRKDVVPRNEAARFIAYIAGMTHLWLLMSEQVDFGASNQSYKADLRRQLMCADSRSE